MVLNHEICLNIAKQCRFKCGDCNRSFTMILDDIYADSKQTKLIKGYILRIEGNILRIKGHLFRITGHFLGIIRQQQSTHTVTYTSIATYRTPINKQLKTKIRVNKQLKTQA